MLDLPETKVEDWTPEMVDILLNGYFEGESLNLLRRKLERGVPAIKTKLIKLGKNYRGEGILSGGLRKPRKGPLNSRELKMVDRMTKHKMPITYQARMLARTTKELNRLKRPRKGRMARQQQQALLDFGPKESEPVRPYSEWDIGEELALAHRYLYYVRNTPVVSDEDYDTIEKEVLEFGGVPRNSLLRKPGSDNAKDYPEHIRALGMYLIFKYAKVTKK